MLNRHSHSEILKVLFLCSFSILSLFLGFFINAWRVADPEWFDSHQRDSESLLIGRMVKSGQDGIFSGGGLLGYGSLNTTPVVYSDMPFSNQYLAYTDGLRFGAYTTYNSQIGAQGVLFSILDRLIPLAPQEKLRLFYAMTSLCSAVSLTAIVFWFYLEFGGIVALFVLISAVSSQWLVVLGRNLCWSVWAFYLPVAVVMHTLRFKRGLTKIKHSTIGGIVFITVFIKCLFNGYEYITSTLVMIAVPFVYYGILSRWDLQRFLKGLFAVAFSSCIAILLSTLILCFQIASVKGSFLDGVNHVAYSFGKRTSGTPQNYPPEYAPGLKASTTGVLVTYLKGTFFNANNYLSTSSRFLSVYLFKVRYISLILCFMILSGLLYFLRNRRATEAEGRKPMALIAATWFSILAPLSWFIVFKAHSYVHAHINFILWQMPFVFFGFALCGLVVKRLFPRFIHPALERA